MEYLMKDLEPKLVLKYFEEISAIPRGSYNEAAVAAFVAARAEALGLYHRVDERNNVFVKKPASKGCESAAPLLLQAHLDMVCEKNADTVHDFTKEGIELILEGSKLRANGTTLGADDGKGVAMMLALMDSDGDAIPHPELQFLFTTGEEVGFWGAVVVDCSDITARRMIGLDAQREGEVCTTSAGAQEVRQYVETEIGPVSGEALTVTVKGLKGGHSAMTITEERGNSNKIMGRVLHNAAKAGSFRIASISGGLMFNAIPRECRAVIVCDPADRENIKAKIAVVYDELKVEFAASDAGLVIETENAPAVSEAFSAKATSAIVETMYNTPNGVRMMNVEVPGLPVTSTNMGIVRMEPDGRVLIDDMLRSASRSCSDDLVDNIITIGRMCGMTEAVTGSWIAAWPYNGKSEMRSIMKELYREQTGKELRETAVHGGLELGVFSEKMPGLDIVTLGCDSFFQHSVTEWLDIESYARVYEFLKTFVSRLAE